MNIQIVMPKTDIVGCRFCYKTEGNRNREISELKTYYYRLTPNMQGIKVGDTVVVSCATGLQVVKVHEVNSQYPSEMVSAYVVGAVDMDAYVEFLKAEKEKAELKEALRRRKKELEGLLAYEILAEKDPDFKNMLDTYKQLGGTL